ncbi:MAG TPA: nitrate- and nitrite sensing domain-containing protein [Actinoplanes sp.]|nr:nitrate- and nitrite sensing domain-containing protein [Actinoplanes sp.]
MLQLLALPLALVVVLVGALVTGQARGYAAAADAVEAVELSLAVQDLVHELQRERGLTVGLLAGAVEFRDELTAQRRRVDGAHGSLDDLLSSAEGPDTGRVRSALNSLAALPRQRGEADAGRAARVPMFQFFTDAIAGLNELDLGLGLALDRTLRTGMEALVTLGHAKELTGQERALVNGAAAAGRFSTPEFQRFVATRALRLAALDRLDRLATPTQRQGLAAATDSEPARAAADLAQRAIAARDIEPVDIDPNTWWAAITGFIDQLRAVQQSVAADITARAGQLRGSAARDLAVLVGVVSALMTATVWLAVSAARGVTRPLRALADDADDLADHRLPAAVAQLDDAAGASGLAPQPPALPQPPQHATREVQRVARTLGHLQTAAFELAVEQAATRRSTTESLANLGRRNQELLRRQLGLITALEAQEHDAANLEQLFELDHLATRMRRNAESLLILAGERNPRRWSTALPMSDVIRAAVSEVEEYQRVELGRIDEAYLAGPAAADLAHMIAELVENGLTFSPATSTVEIAGWHAGAGYQITIVDHGVGMSTEQLRQANARLAGNVRFLSSVGRFVGHFVVGRLAAGLGVDVRLQATPQEGTTAWLLLPSSLLTVEPRSLKRDSGWAHSAHATQSASGAVATRAVTAAEPG